MRFPRSIRWRLQLWYGGLLVAVLFGFGFSAFHLERGRSFRRVDEELQSRLSVLVDALRAVPDRDRDRNRAPELRLNPAQSALFEDRDGFYYAIWMQGREPVLRSKNLPPAVPRPDSRESHVRTRGGFRESFIFAAPVDGILVGCPVAKQQKDLTVFAILLTTVGGLVLTAGLLGGWWLASRAIKPIGEISVTAARIAAGDLSQRICTANAEDELGQLAVVLNSTFARLESAFAQQSRFIADAAHELRTPVAVVLTQAQSILARERPAEEYRETIEACQRAAQRMRRLIESLLELARFDAGQQPIRREPCDLARIADEALALIRPLADERRLEIRTKFAPASCAGDGERLSQIVTNLLANAIEYTPEAGEVTLETRTQSGTAQLVVCNSGPGISPADLPHIFEPFHRGDKSRTASHHAGLGLAIAQAIAAAHGGQITAESSPEGLTTFCVTIPG